MTETADVAAVLNADFVALLDDERFAGLSQDQRQQLTVLLPLLQQAAKAEVAQKEALRPMVVRGEAVALQKQAAAKFDEADALEQRALLAKAVTDARAALVDAEAEADRLASVHRQAAQAERDAADKYTAAQENARQCTEYAEDLALADADPAAQTEAIVKRNAAEQVAEGYRVKAESAATARVQADAALTAARDVVRRVKAALTAAQRVADNPPPLMPGTLTLLFDGIRRVAFGEASAWPQEHTDQVSGLVEELAIKLGVDRLFANRARRELQDEARAKASNAFLPPAGHTTRPSDPGTVFMPLPPRVG